MVAETPSAMDSESVSAGRAAAPAIGASDVLDVDEAAIAPSGATRQGRGRTLHANRGRT